MSDPAWPRVSVKTACEACQPFALGDEARPLLRDGQTPRQLFEALREKQHHADAVRLLAHVLPKPEAVWWACQCARRAYGTTLPLAATAAIQAAERWLSDPSDEKRRAAWVAAGAADLGTPAGCAAVAVFWSGGSLAAPAAPMVPPRETMTAQGAAAAVLLAAVTGDPRQIPERFRQFLALGAEVAAGSNRWK